MARHIFVPKQKLTVASTADRDTELDVLAIGWNDEYVPNDNDLREFDFLVLLEGASRPSWILGTEVARVDAA